MESGESQIADAHDCCARLSQDVARPVENSLSGFFGHLFDTSTYPQRWNCGSWTPLEGWLHIASDVGIFLAYFAIPVALVYFVWKRKDIPFNGIFFLFAAFILLCGTGHLLEAVIFYYPIYRVAGLLKLATAIVSLTTFFVLLRLIPKALELPSLITKNELLRQSDSAKTEFLANMSHEIRTPMTAILGYADLLLEEGDIQKAPENRVEIIQTIRRNGEHLLNVINDILDLSKVEAGKFTFEQIACSPHEILQEVNELMKVRADSKNLDWTVSIEGALPSIIQTDPTRLRQILLNLVGNAIKFTESGSVHLRARYRVVKDSKQLVFEVQDTGIGMSQQQQQQLFEPFVQADNSMSRRFGGTGLGLALSRRFARLLGGDVEVNSEPGIGTTFTLRIDVGDVADVVSELKLPANQPESRCAAKASDNRQLEQMRILLVEDGPDNQRLVSFLLEKQGATVDLAENGAIGRDMALRALEDDTPYDVILMDMQMPVMDGYAATRALRSHGYARPIIALTAHAMAEDRQRCLEAGCDEYSTKPIDRERLIGLLSRFRHNCETNDVSLAHSS